MQDASTAIHTVHVSHGCMWDTGHDTLNDNYVYECQEGVAVQTYVFTHFLNAIIISYIRYFSREKFHEIFEMASILHFIVFT